LWPASAASCGVSIFRPYFPDRNPDDLVWTHLKADIIGRISITTLDDFRMKVKSSILSLQRNPEKVRAFFPEAFFQISGMSSASSSLNEICLGSVKPLIQINYPVLEQNPSQNFYCIPSCGGKIGEARQ
jgi:hypothetical protein